MLKPIKIDLKLNDGTKLCTLDDLEENLSPALFEHFHSGKLAKWLRVRKLEEHADKVEALRTQHLDDKNELDVKLFKNLCEIFVSEVSEEDAREAMQDYQPATFEQNSNDEEIESLKAENEEIKTQNKKLNQDVEALKKENHKFKNLFAVSCNTCHGTGKETKNGFHATMMSASGKLPQSPCPICDGSGRLFKLKNHDKI